MSIEFKQVADAVTCRQVAEAEGLRMHGGRAVCPFHAGADGYNLAFYRDGKCFCHKCHKAADSVQFAAALWRCDQMTAAETLNQRFGLGIDGGRMTAADVARREADRRAARDRQQAQHEAEARAWSAAAEELRAAEDDMLRFSTAADIGTRAFEQALSRLTKAQDTWYLLQTAGGSEA